MSCLSSQIKSGFFFCCISPGSCLEPSFGDAPWGFGKSCWSLDPSFRSAPGVLSDGSVAGRLQVERFHCWSRGENPSGTRTETHRGLCRAAASAGMGAGGEEPKPLSPELRPGCAWWGENQLVGHGSHGPAAILRCFVSLPPADFDCPEVSGEYFLSATAGTPIVPVQKVKTPQGTPALHGRVN